MHETRALRFAVIGCGGMGSLHCQNVKSIAGLETVAYCDVDESKAQKFLERYGGRYATTKPEQVFADSEIDGVLIQTGERWHPRLCLAAAQAGKHIFCEKPIAVELTDTTEYGPGANTVVRAIENAEIQFQFGLCNRLAPLVQRAARMLPHPLYSFCQCADRLSSQACHNLDLAIHVFHQAPLKTVFAQGGRCWGLDPHLPVDSFSAVLTFADGSIHTYVQHGLSYNARLLKYHYQLFGADRMVYLAKRFKECHLMYNQERGKIAQSWVFEGDDWDRGQFGYMGHYEELVELRDAIRNDSTPTMTVRQAREVLAVEKAILDSCRTGKPVDYRAFRAEHIAD